MPENNYETMIREFMKSHTEKKLAIITNVEKNKFYQELQDKLHFEQDERIQFVGTVYDAELLKKIREQAYGYLHGHEVGGTNPSLLEALDSTKLNLLLAVGFNQEVGQDSTLYWTKEEGNLANLLEKSDKMTKQQIEEYAEKSSKRIQEAYNWNKIIKDYEDIFRSE